MKEKIVFISDDDYYIGTLTKGKIYDAEYNEKEPVYSSTGFYYRITNDIGVSQEYYYGLFTTLKEWRQLQIQKIIHN